MNPLIFMTSFGNPIYAQMAHVCIDSLRGKGCYQGDIVVATEGSFQPRPEQRVRTLQAPQPQNRYELITAKTRLAPQIDVTAYDRILIMDIDVVAVSDVAPLFDALDGQVRAATEVPFHTMANASAGGALTPEERELYKDVPAVNAGIVAMDARVFQATMALWAEQVKEYRPRVSRYVDQCPLNAMIVRKEIPFLAWPVGWIEFPPLYPPYGLETRVSPEAKLLHFCAGDKQEVLQDMRNVDELLASLARGEKDASRLAGRDLFFLHQQIKNWKEEAELQRRLANERELWIVQLEQAKTFLTEQREHWEKEAAFQKEQREHWEKEATFQKEQVAHAQIEIDHLQRERVDRAQVDDERQQWVAQLEAAKTFLTEQREHWEQEAAYQKQQARNWKDEGDQLRVQLAEQARNQEESQAWIAKLEEAKTHLNARLEQWEAEAAFQKQQAVNWKSEVDLLRPQIADGARVQKESQSWIAQLEEAKTYLAAQTKQWEAEAAYQKQQALNWKHEAEQVQLILDQREGREKAATAGAAQPKVAGAGGEARAADKQPVKAEVGGHS